MTTSPAKDILDHLELNGLGISGTDLFYHKLPGNAKGITIRDTGGFDTDKTFSKEESISRPTVQIFGRGLKYKYAEIYDRLSKISDFLDQTHEIEINSKRFVSIFRMGEILDLGENTSEEPELSVNFMLEIASI